MTAEAIMELARRHWPADSMPPDEPAEWFIRALESAYWHNCEVCEERGILPSRAIACALHSTYAIEQHERTIAALERTLSMRGPALHPEIVAELECVVSEMRKLFDEAPTINIAGEPTRVAIVDPATVDYWREHVENALKSEREGVRA